MNYPFLYIALDYPDSRKALQMAEKLNEVEGDFGYKLNGDLLLAEGMDTIDEFAPFRRPIFADLKMWKGRGTMGNIVDKLIEKGVNHTNVYAHAGKEYMSSLTKRLEGSGLELLGLTVLTHYGEEDCQKVYGRSLKDSVRMLAEEAYESGCHGIILPPTTLDVVQDLDMVKLTPGIRPEWWQRLPGSDQKQVKTPREAVIGGADILVMGSPIRKDKNPPNALRKTLDEMQVYIYP